MEVEVLRNDPRHRGNAFSLRVHKLQCIVSLLINLGGTSSNLKDFPSGSKRGTYSELRLRASKAQPSNPVQCQNTVLFFGRQGLRFTSLNPKPRPPGLFE